MSSYICSISCLRFKKRYMLLYFLVLLSILQSSRGKFITILPCNDDMIEPFIKQLVKNATEQLPNPYILPSKSEFILLSEGKAWGLSTLKPRNSSSIVCKEDYAIIRTQLDVDEMKGQYRWQRIMMTRSVEGIIQMDTEKFTVYLEIHQSTEKGDNPMVVSCAVTKMQGVTFDITGKNYITWPMVKLTDPAMVSFTDTMHEAVKVALRNALRRELDLVSLSFSHTVDRKL